MAERECKNTCLFVMEALYPRWKIGFHFEVTREKTGYEKDKYNGKNKIYFYMTVDDSHSHENIMDHFAGTIITERGPRVK